MNFASLFHFLFEIKTRKLAETSLTRAQLATPADCWVQGRVSCHVGAKVAHGRFDRGLAMTGAGGAVSTGIAVHGLGEGKGTGDGYEARSTR